MFGNSYLGGLTLTYTPFNILLTTRAFLYKYLFFMLTLKAINIFFRNTQLRTELIAKNDSFVSIKTIFSFFFKEVTLRLWY